MTDIATGRWAIAIHGGAGQMTPATLSPHDDAVCRSGLSSALHAGITVLRAGGSAMDAVTAAVTGLEDDPCFNAGRGSVLAFDGRVQMDAAVMDGAARKAGAVAGVRHIRNPVKLARAVMEAGPHVFLSGEGAEEFAMGHGIEQAGEDWFITPQRHSQWLEFGGPQAGLVRCRAGIRHGRRGGA